MKSKIKLILPIVCISFLVLLPEIFLGGGSGLAGGDAFFHLTRFTEAAMQIRTGHFSYFQQFYTLNYSGKIVNALYGPLAAYFLGSIMLLAQFHGLVFWSIYLFIINVVALSSMVYLQRQLDVSLRMALTIGTLFITTGAVTATASSGGMYALGYAVFPVLVSAAIRLLRDSPRPINTVELVLALTLLAQLHMLALLLGLLTYALAFIIYLILHLRDEHLLKTLLALLKSAGLVLLLNFNVYGGYLEVTHSNPTLAMPFHFTRLYWPAAISFTRINFGNISGFLALLLLFVLFLLIKDFRKQTPWVWFALGMSVLFGFLAFSQISIGYEMTLFQFSARFMAVSFPFALALLGYQLTHNPVRGLVPLTGLTMLLGVVIFAVGTSINAYAFRQGAAAPNNKSVFINTASHYQTLLQPKTLVGNTIVHQLTAAPSELADYLPSHATAKNRVKNQQNEPAFLLPFFYNDILSPSANKITKLTRTVTSHGLTINWYSPQAQKNQIPLIAYAHTQLILNGRTLAGSNYSLSTAGSVSLRAKKGDNHLSVSYQPSRWFSIGIIVQLIGTAAILVRAIIKKVCQKS